jgi:hypothetical protein
VDLGTDTSNGTYADVALETCKYCGAMWLNYHFEYEHQTASGRWYRGIISREVAQSVTPEAALATLEHLPWWMYGGSYFGHAGRRREAPLRALL